MGVTFRNYSSIPYFSADYELVREFLIRINAKKLYSPYLLWGAWEWAVTHKDRDNDNLGQIGLWEDSGKLVAVVTYSDKLGDAYLIVDEAYPYLKAQMVKYAKKELQNNRSINLFLYDGDVEFQRIARDEGFRPTQRTDINTISVLDINSLQSYSLPEGYSFLSMAESWNWYQNHRVMRRSFGNETRPAYDEITIQQRMKMLSSPMINPDLVLAVIAPDGNYVSHCVLWHQKDDYYCYVEPVATDPDYRKLGLGKAVVLEAARRCGELGAMQAVVCSGQQFYYNIGFYPIQTVSKWELVPIEK